MRALTTRERELLLALLAFGSTQESAAPPTAADRERWAARVDDLAVDGTCGCGSCPSVDLVLRGRDQPAPTRQTILGANTEDACIVLFIENDLPKYLELAPFLEDPITEFPLVSDVQF